MRLELSPESRVLIDLRTTGFLRKVGHDPTLSAFPERCSIELGHAAAIDAAIDCRFAAVAIEPPANIPALDRDRMRENLRSREVLDVARFPTVDLDGRYVGTLDGGRLSGHLHVRGVARPIGMEVRVSVDPPRLGARGAWEGRLTGLGIKPFKALLGALRLDDWIRLRLEASFLVVGS
jgi:YceI-like protein